MPKNYLQTVPYRPYHAKQWQISSLLCPSLGGKHSAMLREASGLHSNWLMQKDRGAQTKHHATQTRISFD